MDGTGELRQSLNEVRADMIAAAHQLAVALGDERDALDAGDLEALASAGQAKHQAMLALEHLEGERCHMLRALGEDPAAALRASGWSELHDCLVACRRANEINGAIVNARLGQVRGALSVLTGASASPATYGRGGKIQEPTLASASRLHV